jgi:2-polyprenyl-6-hydroxyphenyl methylase/3-demethylubiquinone-9 3-methyltransferase
MNVPLNVDPAELAKFSELAHRWWDPESEFRPLHQINPLRLAGSTGVCAAGRQRKCSMSGVAAASWPMPWPARAPGAGHRPVWQGAGVAQLHALEAQTPVSPTAKSVLRRWRRAAGQFDVVTCMEMLEHVPDPASVVRACATLVKPGGWVFFSTINRNPKSFLLAIVGAEYVLGMLPRGTHEYAKLIKPSELAGYCRDNRAGCAGHPRHGAQPAHPALLAECDTSVNYLVATRRQLKP